MKFSDIKIKHVYNVIFDPVRNSEFDGKHLALVLKKNNDMKSTIVLPLSSAISGLGSNKIKISINSLPTSLRGNPTYAVYNQIRTVHASRFIRLKQGQNIVQANVDNKIFKLLINKIFIDITHDISKSRIELLETMLDTECVIKAKSIAYQIKKSIISDEFINESEENIIKLLTNRTVLYNKIDKQNGINIIIENIIKNKL